LTTPLRCHIIPVQEYIGAYMQTKALAAADIGRLIRQKRKQDKLKLAEAAALCNVNYRFLSELENGKPTAEIGKVLQVLQGLGIDVVLKTRDSDD
jgi:HTH-type transcriptional regulator / antitoxin HipB